MRQHHRASPLSAPESLHAIRALACSLNAYAARSCHCLSRCSNRLLHCGFPSNVTSWIGCPSSCIHTFCIVQASASHQVMLPRSGMRTSLAEKTPRVHLCNSEWVKLQSASSDCTVHGNRVLPLRSEAELTADCWINCRVLGQPQSAPWQELSRCPMNRVMT